MSLDKTRLVVAKREDEDIPLVIGAISESTWEILPPEDWDRWKEEMAKKYFDSDWTAYDYIDVIMTYPNESLLALFKARDIVPTTIEAA